MFDANHALKMVNYIVQQPAFMVWTYWDIWTKYGHVDMSTGQWTCGSCLPTPSYFSVSQTCARGCGWVSERLRRNVLAAILCSFPYSFKYVSSDCLELLYLCIGSLSCFIWQCFLPSFESSFSIRIDRWTGAGVRSMFSEHTYQR